MPATGKEEVGCEGVCKVKGKSGLWEDEGTDRVMLQVAWKHEVKYQARICVGKNPGFGCRV